MRPLLPTSKFRCCFEHYVTELLHYEVKEILPLFFIFLFAFQVSVSCGIPDFRSRDGVYAKLSVEYPDLPDPQAMFDISYFYENPRPFFKFAKVSINSA